MANSGGGARRVDRVELQLRVTLHLPAAGGRRGTPRGEDAAWFILGLVQEQLARRFGRRGCQVELTAATGVAPGLLAAMAGFAPALQRALGDLAETGEAWVEDGVLADTLARLLPVQVARLADGRWRVQRRPLAPLH